MKARSPGSPNPFSTCWPSGWLGGISLLILTFLVYIPTYRAGFIWDDATIAAHPLLSEGWRGLRDIWCTTRFQDMVPLTATTFWVEWQIHGGMKEIQHATNVVLQAANAWLVWRLLLHLRVPAAWLGAALFAIHPVCVASVTWLAERKNTLSMFFYLLSLWCYLKSEAPASPALAAAAKPAEAGKRSLGMGGMYWLAFLFFILALLSKTAVVALPVVLLLCIWLRDGRFTVRDGKRVAPFFAFAFTAGVATLVVHYVLAPTIRVYQSDDGLLVRVLAGTRAVWFYLGKVLVPVNLTMHYPRWAIELGSPMTYLPGLALAGAAGWLWRYRQSDWAKACLFGFGYFLIAAGPALGVFNMTFFKVSQVADHLQYFGLPGLLALLAGGLWHLAGRMLSPSRPVAAGLTVALLVPLAVLSWQHQRLVGNPEALWRDNLRIHPGSWTAFNNLGSIAFEKNQFHEAAQRYEQAAQCGGGVATVYSNLGRAYFALGQPAEALVQYDRAIQLNPDDPEPHNNRAVTLLHLTRTNDALGAFQRAVEIAPANATFYCNLAQLLDLMAAAHAAAGRFAEAAQAQEQALRLIEPRGHHELAAPYRSRLERYRAGRSPSLP